MKQQTIIIIGATSGIGKTLFGSGQGTGPCPAFAFFLKTFEIIFLTIPAGQ